MKRFCWLVAFLALFAVGPTAHAAQGLDFGVGLGGSVSYSGAVGDTMSGTGLPVPTVTGVNTPLLNGVASLITGGSLSFTTGAETSFTGGSGAGTVFFGSGGTASITGGIPSLAIAGGTTLLTGTFQSAFVIETGAGVNIQVAFLINQVNGALAAAYGLPGGIPGINYAGSFSMNINVSSSGLGATTMGFNGSGVSGDLTVTVPAPAGLVLAFSGLPVLGLTFLRRRFKGTPA